MTTTKKSIYQRAGEWGVPFGLYLACAAMASIFADWFMPGTVLCSFIVFMVLQFGRPNFIYEQTQAAVDLYNAMPQMQDKAILDVLQRAIDERALPTPIEMVMSVFWFVTFGGSLVSALTALFAQRPLPDKRKLRH